MRVAQPSPDPPQSAWKATESSEFSKDKGRTRVCKCRCQKVGGHWGLFRRNQVCLQPEQAHRLARRPGCAEGPPVTAAWLLLQPETLPSPGQTLRLRAPPGTRGDRVWETWALGQQGALWHASAPFPSLAPRARTAGRVPVKCQARLVAAAVY